MLKLFNLKNKIFLIIFKTLTLYKISKELSYKKKYLENNKNKFKLNKIYNKNIKLISIKPNHNSLLYINKAKARIKKKLT
jgi:hypothetical protein